MFFVLTVNVVLLQTHLSDHFSMSKFQQGIPAQESKRTKLKCLVKIEGGAFSLDMSIYTYICVSDSRGTVVKWKLRFDTTEKSVVLCR